MRQPKLKKSNWINNWLENPKNSINLLQENFKELGEQIKVKKRGRKDDYLDFLIQLMDQLKVSLNLDRELIIQSHFRASLLVFAFLLIKHIKILSLNEDKFLSSSKLDNKRIFGKVASIFETLHIEEDYQYIYEATGKGKLVSDEKDHLFLSSEDYGVYPRLLSKDLCENFFYYSDVALNSLPKHPGYAPEKCAEFLTQKIKEINEAEKLKVENKKNDQVLQAFQEESEKRKNEQLLKKLADIEQNPESFLEESEKLLPSIFTPFPANPDQIVKWLEAIHSELKIKSFELEKSIHETTNIQEFYNEPANQFNFIEVSKNVEASDSYRSKRSNLLELISKIYDHDQIGNKAAIFDKFYNHYITQENLAAFLNAYDQFCCGLSDRLLQIQNKFQEELWKSPDDILSTENKSKYAKLCLINKGINNLRSQFLDESKNYTDSFKKAWREFFLLAEVLQKKKETQLAKLDSEKDTIRDEYQETHEEKNKLIVSQVKSLVASLKEYSISSPPWYQNVLLETQKSPEKSNCNKEVISAVRKFSRFKRWIYLMPLGAGIFSLFWSKEKQIETLLKKVVYPNQCYEYVESIKPTLNNDESIKSLHDELKEFYKKGAELLDFDKLLIDQLIISSQEYLDHSAKLEKSEIKISNLEENRKNIEKNIESLMESVKEEAKQIKDMNNNLKEKNPKLPQNDGFNSMYCKEKINHSSYFNELNKKDDSLGNDDSFCLDLNTCSV